MKLTPLADRVIVKPIEEPERKKGGIIIPDTAKEKPQQGEVVAVGPGRRTNEGERIAPEVKKGDRVIFGKYAATEYTIDDEKLFVMKEDDIIAIV
jgi:chaperonin GroES